jgi:hypothetical protein
MEEREREGESLVDSGRRRDRGKKIERKIVAKISHLFYSQDSNLRRVRLKPRRMI